MSGGKPKRSAWPTVRIRGDGGASSAPGATIGILGGGQLGRMTAQAASRLGYRCHVFATEADSPAGQVCGAATVADFTDLAALDRFAAAVDVVTFEFENIPATAVRFVAASKLVLPRAEILEITQDRLREKDFLHSIDVATAAYREVSDAAALVRAMRDFGYPAVLKSVRMGYDGKGQVTLTPETKPEEAWRHMGAEIGILESFVDFACEISVIVARGAQRRLGDLPAGGKSAYGSYPRHHHRPGADRGRDRDAGRGDRAPYCRKARSRRSAGGRDVRDPSRRYPGQRTGAAPAQFGPLDDRRVRYQPVRAVGARDCVDFRSGRLPTIPMRL